MAKRFKRIGHGVASTLVWGHKRSGEKRFLCLRYLFSKAYHSISLSCFVVATFYKLIWPPLLVNESLKHLSPPEISRLTEIKT